MSIPLGTLKLTVRIANALYNSGFVSAEAIAECSEQELGRWPNIGPKALREIQDALADHGLKLRVPYSDTAPTYWQPCPHCEGLGRVRKPA